ncbi:hypothetical protein [Collimonas arenae]|uniref:hypothetical protein n=1 Tax=Collimonas arenae TaxID=279058 RepID=UPI0012E0062D|nr:hypothetical protein [Collimonas arenae]
MRIRFLGWLLFIFCTSTIASSGSNLSRYSGNWNWSDAPSDRTFSLKLTIKNFVLTAQYCAVAKNGQKIDCDDEDNPNINGHFERTKSEALVNFSSFFDAHDGVARIELRNNHVIWHVIKNPVGGDFYAPKDAVLNRN